MKEIIERKYTEKEMQFISEYGKDNFFVWETLSEKEKSVFYKIKELQQNVFNKAFCCSSFCAY